MDLLINLLHNGLEINMYLFLTKWKPLSCVRVFATPWTIPSMEFSRPEYRDLPNPGIEPRSPTFQADSSPAEPQGKCLFLKISSRTFFFTWVQSFTGFPAGSAGKNPPASEGDAGSIPGSGRSPGGGNGNSLQYSCLGNPMDRGAWLATVHGVLKSWAGATKQQHRVLQFTKHPNVPINQGTRANYALIFFNNDLLWFISLRYWKDALCLYVDWPTTLPEANWADFQSFQWPYVCRAWISYHTGVSSELTPSGVLSP